MLQGFDEQYSLPDKTHISKTAVQRLYNKVKDGLLREVRQVDFYSLPTDLWSSLNMTPYISHIRKLQPTTPQLTDTLLSRCLQTRYTPDNYRADVLEESLQSALANWARDEKTISCITSDNGPAAMRKLEWPWLNCFGCDLHLPVTNAVASKKQKTSRALGLCRSLVSTFNLNWIKRTDLRKV